MKAKKTLNPGAIVLMIACAMGSDAGVHTLLPQMDSSEKKRNEAAGNEVLMFMSVDKIFPDPSVRALARAAGKGDIAEIDRLVGSGVNVNSIGAQGAPPLFWAIRNYSGFKRLLELGADPNVSFGDGGTVVHWVVAAKDKRLLAAALEHGGNPNSPRGDTGESALFLAVEAGWERVDMLLRAGANVNAKNRTGSTVAMLAASLGQYEVVYNLLLAGADFRIRNRNGRDLADRVSANRGGLRKGSEASKWQEKVVEWLKKNGVNVREPGQP
jgi:ankyrin repeat protein